MADYNDINRPPGTGNWMWDSTLMQWVPFQSVTTGNTRPPSTPPVGPTTGAGWVGPAGYGFGIPGFETNPMVGGGSWEGTTWPGKQYSGLQQSLIPQTDVTNPNSPYYRPIYDNWQNTTDTQINPAVPYQTTWYMQTYGGKPPPYINIHEQLGDAMGGIAPAKPGFNWASPQALAQLGGYGLPGGWTSMLGFTPGGAKNG